MVAPIRPAGKGGSPGEPGRRRFGPKPAAEPWAALRPETGLGALSGDTAGGPP